MKVYLVLYSDAEDTHVFATRESAKFYTSEQANAWMYEIIEYEVES